MLSKAHFVNSFGPSVPMVHSLRGKKLKKKKLNK